MNNESQPYIPDLKDVTERHSRSWQQSDQDDAWWEDSIRQNRVALHEARAQAIHRKYLRHLKIIEHRKLARRAK